MLEESCGCQYFQLMMTKYVQDIQTRHSFDVGFNIQLTAPILVHHNGLGMGMADLMSYHMPLF